MKRLIIFFGVFAGSMLLSFMYIHLDLFLNPWLRQPLPGWTWHNYFTSRHGLTVLYLHGWLWLAPTTIISLCSSLYISLGFKEMREEQSSQGRLRSQVELEIKAHSQWCSPRCQTFLPQAYREARLINGYSRQVVQKDYDLCHIFR